MLLGMLRRLWPQTGNKKLKFNAGVEGRVELEEGLRREAGSGISAHTEFGSDALKTV